MQISCGSPAPIARLPAGLYYSILLTRILGDCSRIIKIGKPTKLH